MSTSQAIMISLPSPERNLITHEIVTPENISPESDKNENNQINIELENKEQKNSGRNKKGQLKKLCTIKNPNIYFVSENSLDKENLSFCEIIENDLQFNYKSFFEFFFYHLIFFLLSPFLFLTIFKIFGKINIARNMFFYGFSKQFIVQFLEFALMSSSIILYYTNTFHCIKTIEIYMVLSGLLIRMSIVGIKYGTMSQSKINLIKNTTVPSDQLLAEFSMRQFKTRKDIEIEKDLQITLIRKDIDPALLLFQFLEEVNPELENQIRSDYNPFETLQKIDSEATFSKINEILSANHISYDSPSSLQLKNSKNSISKSKLTHATSYSTIANYSKINKRTLIVNDIIESETKMKVYSGYQLAKLIIKSAQDEGFNAGYLALISFFIAIIHALIPSFFRIANNQSIFGENTLEMWLIWTLVITNTYYFFVNLNFLLFGIFEFYRHSKTLAHLSNLMSCKRIETYHCQKFYPTVNFFCKMTLKSWGNLHKIFQNFRAIYKLRVECYLSLFGIFYLCVTIVTILSIFGNFEQIYEQLNIIILLFEVIIIFIIIVILIIIGVIINNHYNIHKSLIKYNKDIISDLLRLYGVYFENRKEYKPENDIYKKGVENLTKIVEYYMMNSVVSCKPKKRLHDELRKKILKKSLKELIEICDEIIEELTFESNYSPFRIVGIAASTQLLQSIFALFGSLTIAIGQKYLKYLLE